MSSDSDHSSLRYCTNTQGLFQKIGIAYSALDWRLFIDSSKRSLKAVLLHNGNVYPFIQIVHSVQIKEDCESVKTLLQLIQYNDHNLDVCGDCKMIAFLLGLQGGDTKHSCFLCLWNSKADEQHYLVKNWPARKDLTPDSHNVLNSSFIKRIKILLAPLHIKLRLAKQFVKVLKPTSRAFCHIRQMFPSISEAKVKGGILVGPQIRRMLLWPIFWSSIFRSSIFWSSLFSKQHFNRLSRQNYPFFCHQFLVDVLDSKRLYKKFVQKRLCLSAFVDQ